MLEVPSPALQRVTLLPPFAGAAPQQRCLMRDDPQALPGNGRVGFRIDVAPAAGQPLRLWLDQRGVMPASLRFQLRSESDYLRQDSRWLVVASLSFAIMLSMAAMALVFAWRLREATFLYYAIYVLGYGLVMALETGYVVHPLGLEAIGQAARFWGRLGTTTSIVAAVLFLERFADLAQYLPRARHWLRGYAALVLLIGLPALLPLPWLDALGRALVNPLLILGGPLLLGIAAAAAWRGSRYAGLFLLGWTPLLLVTVVGSLQGFGMAAGWTWSDEALAAGAFEALVLSLGLAERSTSLRRDRDQARQLADLDPLTCLLNRRAWHERVTALKQAARRRRQPLALMFLDVDHFKRLNDRYGHRAGDDGLRALAQALHEELRGDDLIGRYGGEEFVIALPGIDAAQATAIADRIRERFRAQAALAFPELQPTVSIGVVQLRPGDDANGLVQRADEALYASKSGGRNRVVAVH
ncbi:periplasmic/7TM domain sensor diguanylate cyclase [Xanthomonas translucens pv. poae]|uniref:diguanylate cyclase n=1 Tax=Xanthomonas graminis pv. poae TaxID=227946 RepID=A0A0K3A150_9XANT|nr:diguanylate cyclase [Xanthomonas translucens]UKE62150.1 GGDEF domain-containing protein [Xanthomonas translucens pv. poae]CTP91648.1 periplasmic/7TM domain sensor diguanylate cyclase [Xanthomonas translucens pv. poae]